jgi:Ca-activated chloride channel family protein
LPAGAPSPTGFALDMHLETGVGLKDVSSPSHGIDVAYASANTADVKLKEQGTGGNRDFVLRYRLAGDKIETGLLLTPRGQDGEGYFALMMEPPRRPTQQQIPSREYIFLLDVSGSMHGFPLDTAKALMRKLLGQLRPTDHFDVALFSGANYVWNPGGSVPATPDNIRTAVDLIEKQHGGGGTELMGGLRASYAIPRKNKQISRTVVVVTDGYVGVEAEAFRFVRERLDDANLFAFGIGSSVNRALIEGLARAGRGEPFIVLKPEKAAAEAERLRAMIETPVLTRVGVAFEGFQTSEISPPKLPDLLARRPLVVFGKYRGEPGGQVRVSGFGGGGVPISQTLPVRAADAHARNEALRWLWARSWVATLEDERHMGGGQPVEDAITDLGLRHSLLTPFTSFVAVDQQIANRNGQSESVRQPLPMPQGVSNLAVAEESKALKSTASGFGRGAIGGLRGIGSGGGGMAMMAPAAPAAAPPPPSGSSGHLRMKREAQAEADEGALGSVATRSKDDRRAAPADKPAQAKVAPAVIISNTSADLQAPELLLAAVKARLTAIKWDEAPRHATTQLTLRLSVDVAGKVVAVDVVSGDAGLAAFVKAKLVGLTSGARPTAKVGTLVLTVRVNAA